MTPTLLCSLKKIVAHGAFLGVRLQKEKTSKVGELQQKALMKVEAPVAPPVDCKTSHGASGC